MFSLDFLWWQQTCFRYNFEPVLRFAGFTFANFDLASKISPAAGPVCLSIIGSNGGPRLCQLMADNPGLTTIRQLARKTDNANGKITRPLFEAFGKFLIILIGPRHYFS